MMSYTFVLETDGLRLYHNGSKYYLAQSAKADPVFYLGEIIIYDAIGKPDMGTMTVETVTEGQEYLLTVSANEEFLSDPTTLYPVTIDPSLTVSDTANGINSIEDAPVYAGYPNTKFGAYLFNPIGTPDSTFGIGRTVVRLNGLINSEEYTGIAAHQIQNVTFHVLDVSGTATQYVNLFPLTENTTWTESTVTWNNIGGYNTSVNYGDTMTIDQWTEFDITDLVKAWKNNTYSQDAGFILVNENEANLKTFASSEYSTASYRPYVTMIYDPAISGGSGFDDAETIALGTGYTVEIDEAYELKYYKFVPNATGFYTFACTSRASGDPYSRLYNSEETEIAYDNDSASDLKFRLTYHLISGTTYYFVADCVGDSTGSYEFNVAKTTSQSYVDASPLIIRSQAAVFIASPYEAECYKFTPPVDGEYMFISSDNTGDPSIWCYDSSLNLLDDHHNSAGSSNFKLVIKLEQGKTYYIVANEFLDGTGSFFFRTYRSLSYVNYYDSSFASDLTLRGSITNANAFADYVYSNYFGLKMNRVGSATQYATIIDNCERGDNECCTTTKCGANCATDHHKSIMAVSQQLYDSPREDDHLYVLWTNRGYGTTYCYAEGNDHWIIRYIACVVLKRPVIHFMSILGDDSDVRLACMGITLAHETAHTLGMDDVYDNPGHDVDNASVCVMERFEEGSATTFYENVLLGYVEPFCDSCELTIRPLVASTVISGNQ